jgi:hypothetical protein
MNLQKIFGPSQKETWTKLSEELEATFIKGGIWNASKVVAHEKKWTVTLDTFAVHTGKVTIPFTRMRAPFISKDGFRFKVYRRGFFSGIAIFFGRKTVSAGIPDFDKKFVIQSNDEFKLRKLFAHDAIRQVVESQKEIHLEIKDDEGWTGTKFPSDVDELYFHASGIIKDNDRLKSMFRLFAEILNELVTIGSANERTPDVKLK